MKLTGNVTQMGEGRIAFKFLNINLQEVDLLKILDTDERTILERIFKKIYGNVRGCVNIKLVFFKSCLSLNKSLGKAIRGKL